MKILYNNRFSSFVCYVLIVSMISCASTRMRVKKGVSSGISDWEEKKHFTLSSEDKSKIESEFIRKSEDIGKLDDLQIRLAVFSFLNSLLDKAKKSTGIIDIIKEEVMEFIREVISNLLDSFKDWLFGLFSGSKMGTFIIQSNVKAEIYIDGEFLGYSKDEEGDRKWSLAEGKYKLEIKYKNDTIHSQYIEIKENKQIKKICNYYEK